jgi:HlyD family secretion protein
MKRRKFALILAAALIGTSAWIWRGISEKEKTPRSQIHVSGHIEATEVDLAFKIPGRVVRIMFDEGDRVGAGDLVALLDARELDEQLRAARATLEEARSRMPQLQTQISQQSASTVAQEEQARAALAAAKAQLRDLLAGARQQEIRQAEADVEATRAELAKLEEDFRRADALVQREIIARQSWEHAAAAYEVARERHKAAQERLALVKEGPRQEQIQAAKAQVALAEANLRLASTGWLQVERLEKELSTVRAQVERAEATLRLAQTQRDETILRSPISGVVLVKDAEEGEVLPAGTPVLTLGDLDNVWLKAYIQEEDLGRVQLGQRVQIKTDTFPGKVYEGVLSFISDSAEFTPKNVQTQKERVKLVYRIKVSVANRQGELKPGMPADGVILLGQVPSSPIRVKPMPQQAP